MKKSFFLFVAAVFAAVTMQAQVADSLYVADDDNADFTFTESQLDEDNDAAQTVSNLVTQASDPYLSKVGYRWSAMRFRIRAMENKYSNVYMNGVPLNDAERGNFSYSMVGGLNDATRNQEGVTAYDYNRFGMAGIGGATSYDTRASQFAQGSKVALSGCNRNYLARVMFTHGTGITKRGWAFATSVGYRWAKEGVIEGTFYNSVSYFLAAEKLWDRHSLSLVTFGSPTERGQQGASTEEAYALANSHYYNPNWGYQNGKKRNSRVVRDYEPTAIATWDFNINEKMKLTTSAGAKYAMYSSTALGWNNNAADPRPDYYKNLPSSVLKVYNTGNNDQNTYEFLKENPFLLDEWEALYDYWTSSKANRQVNWDRMYYMNRLNEAAGGEALYYQERRHNDQLMFSLNSVFNHNVSQHNKYSVGVNLSSTKGMHYKTMTDLLGATRYTDVDKFAARDYGFDSPLAQNDLDHPNRQIGVGDKFGYDYNIYVNKARAFAHYEHNHADWSLRALGYIDGTQMEREGLMRSGRAPENSLGKSGKAKFLSGGGRVGASVRANANSRWTMNAGVETLAPLAANSFVAPRLQNNYVNNLRVEKFISLDAAYQFRVGIFSGKVSAYFHHYADGVEQTAFYNDLESRFTYLTMSNIKKRAYGLEAAFVLQATSNLSFNFMANIGDSKYINNPLAQVSYEGMDSETIKALNTVVNPFNGKQEALRVVANGMRTNGTPLTALSLGVNYNIKSWFFELTCNYYDRVYVDFSEYRRLNKVRTTGDEAMRYWSPEIKEDGTLGYGISNEDAHKYGAIYTDVYGNVVDCVAPSQEKFKGGFMLDASIGKFIRLKHGKSLSINLSAQNLTNNRNLRTGGYEQNRDDNYSSGEAKAYQFSRHSKYYYANAINFFLNVGFKF